MFGGFVLRDTFCREVSWSVQTVEYQRELVKLIGQGKRVLEVGAGRGILGLVMPEQLDGEWICTESQPPPDTDHVRKMDALHAIKHYRPDVVYASWIPYGSRLDFEIAQLASKQGIPCIFVGEGDGGCTGSGRFWNTQHTSYKIVYPDITHDVPQWPGLHDHTYMARPR